jgi:hypothetical protein
MQSVVEARRSLGRLTNIRVESAPYSTSWKINDQAVSLLSARSLA